MQYKYNTKIKELYTIFVLIAFNANQTFTPTTEARRRACSL